MTPQHPGREILDHLHIVSCHEHACTLAGKTMEQTYDLIASLRIEVSRRLVGKNQLRAVEQGACDHDAARRR